MEKVRKILKKTEIMAEVVKDKLTEAIKHNY